jgi:hypothetical protein
VPRLVSDVTEIVTGLGMLGLPTLAAALAERPLPMVDLDDRTWERLCAAWQDGLHAAEFHAAFLNGEAFLAARDGLRGRVPERIEWRGPTRSVGDDTTPVDLRVDHVFLVSCKYLSKILGNVSPASLFDRALAVGTGTVRDLDWYHAVAPAEYQHLYDTVVRERGLTDLPVRAADLATTERQALRTALGSRRRRARPVQPGLLHDGVDAAAHGVGERIEAAYLALCDAVSTASAERWEAAVPTRSQRRALLWRLLRIGAAPYFVLGSQPGRSLRLRVATPWDWQRRYELKAFEIAPGRRSQPSVDWTAAVREHGKPGDLEVHGHVEVRWSHGRFGGPPEAKVYLDTPHEAVPGYVPLV